MTGGGRRVAVQLLAQRLALLVGHHGEVEVDVVDAVERRSRAAVTRCSISLRSGQPGDGEGDEHADRAVGADVDVADHVEVDDRAVQLGVLDRAQGLEDLGRR